MTRFIAYLRVSTQKQGKSGLGLEAQRAAVEGHAKGGKILREYVETESGKKGRDKRPQLDAALRDCKRTGATLLVAKLDRLARNVEFTASLMNGGVPFVAADNPHATPLTIHILAAMAEHERGQISARTKAALGAAKKRNDTARARGEEVKLIGGPREGSGWRPEFQKLGTFAAKSKADIYASGMVEVMTDIGSGTLQEIAYELMAREIKTPRGLFNWTPAGVRALQMRISKL